MTTNRASIRGFSIVEALLAVTVFGIISAGIIGAIIYGRAATAGSGDRTRAAYLAEEGLEAARNIRNAGYANLVDGTYGLVQSGNTWTLSGSSDVNDIYTRTLTIATSATNRRTITGSVSWNGVTGNSKVDVATQLTNWRAPTAKSWSVPSQYSTLDTSGTIAGYEVATAGSYAYLIRNSSTGPNFFVINISTPTNPTVVGSMTLTGTPTNIAISGNYAYVSNALSTAELQIVNVATPTAPALTSTYNANGNAGGLGVFVSGNYAYLSRAANATNDELVVVNISNPASPTRASGYSLNIAMYEPYVNGSTAYIATGSDTQELLVINFATLTSPVLGTSINLPGTTDATTITGQGTNLFIGQGSTLYAGTTTNATAPTSTGSIALTGTINDIAVDASRNNVLVGTNSANSELQIVSATNMASPSLLSSVNMTGSLSLSGISYSSVYDVAPGASSNTAGEFVVFGPN